MGGLWRRIRQADHALLWLCEKFTQVVAVSLLWLLACVPLVTLVPATAALYYACMKAIRRDWGGPSAAFQTSFRENWKQGIGLSLVVLSLSGACLYPILAGTSGFACLEWVSRTCPGFDRDGLNTGNGCRGILYALPSLQISSKQYGKGRCSIFVDSKRL